MKSAAFLALGFFLCWLLFVPARRLINRRARGRTPEGYRFAGFSDEAKSAMHLACVEAQRLGHEHLGTEHFLLALMREDGGVAVDVLVYAAGLARSHSRRGASVAARRALAVLLDRPREEIGDDLLLRFPWHRLRYAHQSAVRAGLVDAGSLPATVNVTLSHMRGILREAWRLGYLSAEELARIRDVAGVRGESLPAGRALSAGERSAIFRSCALGPQPARAARPFNGVRT